MNIIAPSSKKTETTEEAWMSSPLKKHLIKPMKKDKFITKIYQKIKLKDPQQKNKSLKKFIV